MLAKAKSNYWFWATYCSLFFTNEIRLKPQSPLVTEVTALLEALIVLHSPKGLPGMQEHIFALWRTKVGYRKYIFVVSFNWNFTFEEKVELSTDFSIAESIGIHAKILVKIISLPIRAMKSEVEFLNVVILSFKQE